MRTVGIGAAKQRVCDLGGIKEVVTTWFDAKFCPDYQVANPLDEGYSVRKTLYNLYHVLNHLNLFGGSYLGQAEDMIERLLAEL